MPDRSSAKEQRKYKEFFLKIKASYLRYKLLSGTNEIEFKPKKKKKKSKPKTRKEGRGPLLRKERSVWGPSVLLAVTSVLLPRETVPVLGVYTGHSEFCPLEFFFPCLTVRNLRRCD